MLAVTMCVVLCRGWRLAALCAAATVASAESRPNASELFIVSVGFSDALPGWHRSVLEVKPDGRDLVVRYIRVMPASRLCGEATKIMVASSRLPNTSLNEITGGTNLCAITPAFLENLVRAFPPKLPMLVFAGDSYAVGANCGANTAVIRLPNDWKVNMARLERKRPGLAALWKLEKTIGTRAFGAFPYIDVVPPEIAARLRPADEGILAELKSGKFDVGLTPRSFRDDVAALRRVSDETEFSVKLVDAQRFNFLHYAAPGYSPLALQARISGSVELELSSNLETREMEQVTVISGHPLLARGAADAAQQWRCAPGAGNALRSTRVVLEFRFHCP